MPTSLIGLPSEHTREGVPQTPFREKIQDLYTAETIVPGTTPSYGVGEFFKDAFDLLTDYFSPTEINKRLGRNLPDMRLMTEGTEREQETEFEKLINMLPMFGGMAKIKALGTRSPITGEWLTRFRVNPEGLHKLGKHYKMRRPWRERTKTPEGLDKIIPGKWKQVPAREQEDVFGYLIEGYSTKAKKWEHIDTAFDWLEAEQLRKWWQSKILANPWFER